MKRKIRTVAAIMATTFILASSVMAEQTASEYIDWFIKEYEPALKSNLTDDQYDFVKLEDSNTIYLNICIEGGLMAAEAKKSGLNDSFKLMIDGMTDMTDSIWEQIEKSGRDDIHLAVVLQNDKNADELLLAYIDNELVYDYTSGSESEDTKDVVSGIASAVDDSKYEELEQKYEQLQTNYLDLSERYEKLRKRYKKLTGKAPSEPINLSSGIYIVGDDIEAGHYFFDVVGGSAGYVYVWDTYEAYKNNEWDSYFYQDVISKNYESSYAEALPNEISNIILEDGNCLVINSVVIEATKK